jgi:hypothetical protein
MKRINVKILKNLLPYPGFLRPPTGGLRMTGVLGKVVRT